MEDLISMMAVSFSQVNDYMMLLSDRVDVMAVDTKSAIAVIMDKLIFLMKG